MIASVRNPKLNRRKSGSGNLNYHSELETMRYVSNHSTFQTDLFSCRSLPMENKLETNLKVISLYTCEVSEQVYSHSLKTEST